MKRTLSKAPLAFRIVSYVFVAVGVLAVYNTLRSLFPPDNFRFDLDLLALPIAAGLFRRDPTWRLVAFVFTLIWSVGASLVATINALVFLGPSPVTPLTASTLPSFLEFEGELVSVATYGFWQLWVLHSKAVRAFCYETD